MAPGAEGPHQRVFRFFGNILGHLGFGGAKEALEVEDQKKSSLNRYHNSSLFDAPVISRCGYGEGGVQGLRWYSEKLQADKDGDVAEEFLHEVTSDPNGQRMTHKLEVEVHTRPVKLKGPVCATDGNVHQFVESSGELRRV